MERSSQANVVSLESEELNFRRQYIIAPRDTVPLEGWTETDIGNGYMVSAHPHLQTTKVQLGDRTLVVLGFLLDPFDPTADDEKIAGKLIEQSDSFTMLQDGLKQIAGRYVIIFVSQVGTRVFSDPAGFRQIFHFQDRKGIRWVSSQPSLMARFHELSKDENVLEDLGKLALFRDTTEYWFPGETSLFKGVFHLTPNHYFDMDSGQSVRYWPMENLEPLPREECIESTALVLQGIMRSAVERFDLSMAVTGGLDTRVLLAASKDVADEIFFFTHTHERLNENNSDITIPRSISEKYDLNHNVVKYIKNIPDSYRETFHMNIPYARDNKLTNTYSIQKHFLDKGRDYMVVNGVCGEITRCFHRFPPFVKMSPRVLSVLVDMKGSRTAEMEFGRWLDKIEHSCPRGFDLLDLFYWENRNAKWAALSYHEYDMGFDSLSPFNCRQVLEDFLSVDRSLRLPPSYSLHRELISYMWPDLMNWPINPPETSREKLVAGLKGSSFYEYLRMAKLVKKYLL